MKIILKDTLIILFLFTIWFAIYLYISKTDNKPMIEVVKAIPGHLLITVLYYAICNVCYSILFISDCNNEYKELMDELEEGRKYFKNKGIKYN